MIKEFIDVVGGGVMFCMVCYYYILGLFFFV